MQKLYVLLSLLFISGASQIQAQSDTIQTFSFKDSTKRSGKFKFPAASENYRKVYMLYTLKCYPKVSAYDKKYACGEWDYLTYTFVTDTAGITYEIARYITPYGINLTLGPNGFTWIYDVTDYQHLLRDSVKLSAGNTQELLDLKFVFVKGIAPAKVVKINQIWDKGATSYSYADLSNDVRLKSKSVKVESNAEILKFRSRITGHGHNSNDGKYPHCCEWKDNTHMLYSGNKLVKDWHVWQTLDCADNPVFPQGGTWPYAREGWCPGDRVKDTEFDVTHFQNADSINLDYQITPVPASNLGMGGGNYVMAMHLIQYEKPLHTNDAEIYDILSPTNTQMYNKFNPSCIEPKVSIRNNSADTMTSLDIEYKMSGGYTMKYQWSGKLAFLETQTIALPIYDGGFYRGDGKNIFSCNVTKRNKVKDSYAENDTLTTTVKVPDTHKTPFYIEFKTNVNPEQNRYFLRDAKDSVIFSRDNAKANTLYRDTIKNLKPGCYTLEVLDDGTDGMNFWANPDQGSGYVRMRRANATAVLKNFGSDFGYRIYYAFIADSITVGKQPPIEVNAPFTDEAIIVPNPNNGTFKIITAGLSGKYTLEVVDALGKMVYNRVVNAETEPDMEVNGLHLAKGIYFVKLSKGSEKIVRKMLVQ